MRDGVRRQQKQERENGSFLHRSSSATLYAQNADPALGGARRMRVASTDVKRFGLQALAIAEMSKEYKGIRVSTGLQPGTMLIREGWRGDVISHPWTTRDHARILMAQHAHKFTIADDAAVHALLNKLTKNGSKQGGRGKLLRALDDAARHYEDSNQKVRQAFFHGLLTGYAVALKVR